MPQAGYTEYFAWICGGACALTVNAFLNHSWPSSQYPSMNQNRYNAAERRMAVMAPGCPFLPEPGHPADGREYSRAIVDLMFGFHPFYPF